MKNDTVSKSYFCVLNNPCDNGYNGEPQEVLEQMKNDWISNKTSRRGYWAYCISADGLPHVHMVLESDTAMRFSAIKKVYSKAHISITKGSRQHVMSYINKKPPYDEKGERIITTISFGDIVGNKQSVKLSKLDLMRMIECKIENGMTPEEIMSENIIFRKEETLVRKAFFAKRYKETPPIREVKVIWHIGESGTGKTYEYVRLCEEYGDSNVYMFSDFANKGVGGLDNYNGEKILFIDELKKGALPLATLLVLLQGYRQQIHCRYANSYALWTEVHITSVFPPEDIYKSIVQIEDMDIDSIQQLLRRITKYVFHFKVDNEFKRIEIDGSEYTEYRDLKIRAIEYGFKNI